MDMGRSDISGRRLLTVTLVTGLLATAVFGYALSRSGQQTKPAATDLQWTRMDAEIKALRGELSELRDDVALLRGRLASGDFPKTPIDRWQRELITLRQELEALRDQSAAMRSAEEKAYLAQPSATASITTPALRDATAADAEHFGAINDRFMTEIRDSIWSASAEEGINQAFQSPELAGIHPGAIDCRTSLCRFDVQLENVNMELEMLIMPLLGDRFERMAVEVSEKADGWKTVYLGRSEDAFIDR